MGGGRRAWNILVESVATDLIPLAANPGGAGTLWRNQADGKLYLGADEIGSSGGGGGTVINDWVSGDTWANGVSADTIVVADTGIRQLVLSVELDTAQNSGYVTFEIFNDVGLTDLAWEHTWDLATAIDIPSTPAYIESETPDTLYIRVTNNTGGGDFTGSWTVKAQQITLAGETPPLAPDVGPGLSYVSELLQVNTHASVGTTVDGSNRVAVVTDQTQPARIIHSANGLVLDGVLDLSTEQTVAGTKLFTRMAMPTIGISGPPVTTDHYRGEMVQDVDGVIWHCIAGIASGDGTDTWAIARPQVRQQGATLGEVLASNSIETGEIVTIANAGCVQRMRVWCVLDGYVGGEYAIPFRVRFYPNPDRKGRDQLAGFAGVIRGTAIAGNVGAGSSTVLATDYTVFDRGGLVRLINDDGTQQEFGRVLSLTGGVILDDALVQTPGYLIGDQIVTVVELPEFAFWNDSGLNNTILYYEIENDHESQSVRFVFDVLYENSGFYEWDGLYVWSS